MGIYSYAKIIKKKFSIEVSENQTGKKYLSFIFLNGLDIKNQPCIFAPRYRKTELKNERKVLNIATK